MQPDILETRQGGARRLTLNRPKALNALTRDMVGQLVRHLAEYEADPSISLIVLDAAGEKAFCAGGDVARLYSEAIQGNLDFCVDFWSELYALIAQIAKLETPFVSLMNGIVMGGGVGISAHGGFRVVTERTILSMPECGIGLVPDVGVSHLLANAPEDAALYVALTGAPLNAAAAISMGLADHFVASDNLGALTEALMESCSVAVIDDFVSAPSSVSAQTLPPEALRAFSGDAATLHERVASHDGPWVRKALAALENGSPVSLALTRELLTKGRSGGSLVDALERELGAVRFCLLQGDFLEGVRAAIIDKDRQPVWKPFSGAPPEVPSLPIGRPSRVTSQIVRSRP